MDIESYKALSHVIVHDTSAVVKQLQKELAKEKRAHKLSVHKHESLLKLCEERFDDFHEEVGPVTFCAECGSALSIRYDDYPVIFTFKRNIGVIPVCRDCEYLGKLRLVESKVKGSIWLDPMTLEIELFYRIMQDEGTQDDQKLFAAFIIQHAFRREWDWRNPMDQGGTGG